MPLSNGDFLTVFCSFSHFLTVFDRSEKITGATQKSPIDSRSEKPHGCGFN